MSDDELRDTFAAAALTGLLVHANDTVDDDEIMDTPSDIAYTAYQMADAMLRERANTNHDAVPAAIARTDAGRNRTDKAALRPGKGAGNTPRAQPTPGEDSAPREGT